MPKTRRDGLAKCKARKTASGVPYRCFATKAEKCAHLSLLGSHPSECRRPASNTATRHPRRPIGNPIDPCVATHEDLQAMTVNGIKNFMRKYRIPIPRISPTTGLPVVKSELIQAALAGAQSCPRGGPPINPETASIRDLGLALKYRGIIPPEYGDGTCGFVNPKTVSQLRFNRIGKGKKTPCRAQFKVALQQELAQKIAVAPVSVPPPPAPAPLVAAAKKAPKKVKMVTQTPTKVTQPVRVEIKAPVVETPVVVLPAEEILPAAIVPQAPPPPPVKTTVQQVYDPNKGAGSVVFKTLVPTGREYNSKLRELMMQADSENTFAIDQACLLHWKPERNITPINNMMIAGMLFHTCAQISGQQVCNRVLLNITYLGENAQDQMVANWRNRVAQYRAVSTYQKGVSSMLVIPYAGAWLCGKDDVSFKYTYQNPNTGKIEEVESLPGINGFLSAAIPKGFVYFTMQEFLEWSKRTNFAPNDAATFGVVPLVKALIARFKDSKYVPRHIGPAEVGFLFKVGGPGSEVYAVIQPPLMTSMDEISDFAWDSYEPTSTRDMLPIMLEREYAEYISEISPPH